MLSSDAAQVVSYSLTDAGHIAASFRPISPQELAARGPKSSFAFGAKAFLAAGLEVRTKLYDGFRVSISDATEIYAAFVNDLSPGERQVIGSIALDDAYCGRGVVS